MTHCEPFTGQSWKLPSLLPNRVQRANLAAKAASGAVDSLTITTPDDWHLHVRDGDSMRSVVPHSAQHFARAIIMPNLVPPVTTTQMVGATEV
jgi:dihydroorotase